MPERWPISRSKAKWVLPVLVGPRTAVSRASESFMVLDCRLGTARFQGRANTIPYLIGPSDKAEIGWLSPFAQGFGLIAGRRPIGRPIAPILRPAGGPQKGRMRGDMRQGPADIGRIVAGDAEFRARLHQARKQIEIGGLDEAPLRMAPLRPGIREQQEHAIQRPFRQG